MSLGRPKRPFTELPGSSFLLTHGGLAGTLQIGVEFCRDVAVGLKDL